MAEYYLTGESVKALVRRLEGERGQVVRSEVSNEVRLDLTISLPARDVYRLESMAAHYGVPKRGFATRLLVAAILTAARVTDAPLDNLEEDEWVALHDNRDYYARRIEAERRGWASSSVINEPEDRCEERREG